MLLSAEEMSMMVQKYLKYKFEKQEVNVIKLYFNDTFQRKEIKRTEFLQFMKTEFKRQFDSVKAMEFYQKIKKPLQSVQAVMACFKGAVEVDSVMI